MARRSAEVRREVQGIALGRRPSGARLVQVPDERVHEAPTQLAERLPLLGRDRQPRVGRAAMVLTVAPPIRRAEAALAGTETGEAARRAGPSGCDQALQRTPVKAAVPARGREGGDPALVGPSTQRVGIDAEQPARLTEREAIRLGSVGGWPKVGHACSRRRRTVEPW